MIKQYLPYLPQIDVVYDIGAHHGVFTREYKKIIDAEFYMFEGNPNHHKPRDIQGKWFNALLSDKQEVKTFYTRNGTGDSYYKETEETGVKFNEMFIESTTLKQVFEENDLRLPNFIKIDTQGSEIDILSAVPENFFNSCWAIVSELPSPGVEYNIDAPTYVQYINFFGSIGFHRYTQIATHWLTEDKVAQYDYLFFNDTIDLAEEIECTLSYNTSQEHLVNLKKSL